MSLETDMFPEIILNIPWSLGCVADIYPVAFFSPAVSFSSTFFWDSNQIQSGQMSLSLLILVFLLLSQVAFVGHKPQTTDSVISALGDSAFYITFTAQIIVIFPALPCSLTSFILFPVGWCHYLLSPGLLCNGFFPI